MDVRQLLDLKGRAALVTGGYGIYGAPISEALAEAGAHVDVNSSGEAGEDRRVHRGLVEQSALAGRRGGSDADGGRRRHTVTIRSPPAAPSPQ